MGDSFLSELQEIFQTPFSNNNEMKRKTYRPVARQKHVTQTCKYLVEYLNVWFR